MFVQIVPGLGSGSGFWGLGMGHGHGHGHGHRKRYSSIFQQFIALCYFAEQVFWSSVLPVSVSLSMYLCLWLCLYLWLCLCSLLLFVGTENWFPVSAQSQLHRWLYTLCPILSTLGVLIFPETITKYEGVRRDCVPFRSANKRLRLRQCQKRPHRDASSKFSHALCAFSP